jgi:DNA polymerase-3 subunit delta'
MSWSKKVGHDRIKKILQKSILENRIPHSYLFIGIEGIGKEAIAIEFAKAVNCLNPIKGIDIFDACDICKSCKMFDNLSHSNFELVFSLPAGKSGDSKGDTAIDKLSEDQITEIKEQIELKAENNYHRFALSNSTQIRVNLVRDLKKKLALTQNTAGRRVILICNADEMNTEASNAFLKTLEEPQDNVTIILTTAKPDSILPTIQSRCQVLKFGILDQKQIAEKLVQDLKISQQEAILAASLSEGSYSIALESFDENLHNIRSEIVQIFRLCLKKKNYRIELSSGIELFIKQYDKTRIIKGLQLLMVWLRDALYINNKSDNKNIINHDDLDTLKKFVKAFGNKDLVYAINNIEKSISYLYRNVSPQITLFSLFTNLRHFFLDL